MNRILLYLLASFLLFSCAQEPETPPLDQEKEKMRQELQVLRLEGLDKDSSLNQVLKYFNDIQLNLSEIKKKEGLVSISSNNSLEMNETKKTQIIEDIQTINTLLTKNKASLAQLRKLIESKGLQIDELNKMVESLQLSITEKDTEIASLKNDLKDLKISLELLSLENTEKSELIALQETELNKAFYCFGTAKELKEKGVIDQQGGFIGIGKSEKLSETINQEYFTKIDFTKTTQFDIFSKKTRLITSHPKGSYEWKMQDKKVEKLVITNPEKFWSISKYMVIILE